MGTYADVKRSRVKKLLKYLIKKGVEVEKGGEHVHNIKHGSWQRPYPIPFKHNVVNKHIIKALMKLLVNSNICTKEEFDKHIS